MKRRLSEGFSLKKGEAVLDDNDDEAEKQQLRAKPAVVENAFVVPKKLPPGASPLGSPLKPMNHESGKRLPMGMPKEAATVSGSKGGNKLSNNQLSELYSNCIKLSAENKINQKNSWALNLIDYLPDVLETQYKTEDGIANFQAASVTLDTSVKIYSYRVDSVHTETYKVLGGLSRTDARPDVDDGEEAEQQDDEQEGEKDGNQLAVESGAEPAPGEQKGKKERAKKIIVGGVNTLEANVENLNVKKIDMEFSVDPLFRKTSAAFDAGGARGLLLNHLNVYNGCEIIFDSSDTLDHGGSADYDRIDDVDLSDLSPLIGSNVKTLQLCPQLAGFQMTDTLENDGILMDEKQIDEADLFDVGDDDDDGGAAMERSLIEQIKNDGGDEDGDAIVPIDETAAAPKANASMMATNPFLAQRNASLGNMLTSQPNEYDYFNPLVASNWAGPDHWKFRPGTKKPTAAAVAATGRTDEEKDAEVEGDEGKGKKKRGSKKQFFIDFSVPAEKTLLDAFSPPAKPASTLLSAALLDRADNTSTTLPADVHYDVKNLAKLFLKNQWVLPLRKREKARQSMELRGVAGEAALGAVGGGGEDGDAPAFAGLGGNDSDDDDGPDLGSDVPPAPMDGDSEAAMAATSAAPAASGLALVSAPYKVNTVEVQYAKTAKKVDVKALKDGLWTQLLTEKLGAPAKKELPAGTKRDFQAVLNDLPARLPKETRAEVSVPFAFICLLHLANEHNLEITNDGTLDKICIKKT